MKNVILSSLILSTFAFSSSVFARTLTLNLDDVDSISADNASVLIEDLRDGFANIKGVKVNEAKVEIDSQSKAVILFKNGQISKSFLMTTMGSTISGDMGGGGK